MRKEKYIGKPILGPPCSSNIQEEKWILKTETIFMNRHAERWRFPSNSTSALKTTSYIYKYLIQT